jgi:hypothetical protein
MPLMTGQSALLALASAEGTPSAQDATTAASSGTKRRMTV